MLHGQSFVLRMFCSTSTYSVPDGINFVILHSLPAAGTDHVAGNCVAGSPIINTQQLSIYKLEGHSIQHIPLSGPKSPRLGMFTGLWVMTRSQPNSYTVVICAMLKDKCNPNRNPKLNVMSRGRNYHQNLFLPWRMKHLSTEFCETPLNSFSFWVILLTN